MAKGNPKLTHYLTLSFSIIALLISIRGCYIADKSFDLSKQDYYDKFKNIWTGEYDKVNQTIHISPTNKDIIIQKATAFYPDEISDIEWPIRPPENLLHITTPIFNIQRKIAEKVKITKGIVKILDLSRIPIVIEANYTLNGDNLYDKSVYMIEFMAVIDDNKNTLPSLSINGLIYSHQLKKDVDVKKYINELWKNGMNE